jgi:phytol kinase
MIQNIIAAVITLALSLAWLRFMDALAHRGIVEQKLSRKIIHIGTGPLFVLCWLMFNDDPLARYLAALVPLLITVQFILVGVGVIKDEAAVKAMTRHGDPREILRGPLYYGVVFVVCTILFWRNSPVGILALMMMCGGDGLADVVGRRFGAVKIPFNKEKSFAGSAAMFGGGFVFALIFVFAFNAWGYFYQPVAFPSALYAVALISVVATVIESFPFQDIDNITITLAAISLGLWLL